MKTTVELSDDVLARAKVIQVSSGRTLKSLLEEGLRLVLDGLERPADRKPFEIVPFNTSINPEFEGNWERMRDEIYSDRR